MSNGLPMILILLASCSFCSRFVVMSPEDSMLFTKMTGGPCALSMWQLHWITISTRVLILPPLVSTPLQVNHLWKAFVGEGEDLRSGSLSAITCCGLCYTGGTRDTSAGRRIHGLSTYDVHPCKEPLLLYCGTTFTGFPPRPVILLCSSYCDSCPQLHVSEPLTIPCLKSPHPWSRRFDSFCSKPFVDDGVFVNLAFEFVYFVCFILLSSCEGGGVEWTQWGRGTCGLAIVWGIRGQSVELAASFHL